MSSVFLAMPQAYRILVPQLEIKPVPPALEARSPNHWTTREVPIFWYFYFHIKILKNFCC